MNTYSDREDAGLRLASRLIGRIPSPAVVAAIPRGGVVIGAEVARALAAPLTVIYARKLTVPSWPELAFGAIDDDGRQMLEPETVRAMGLTREDVESARIRVYEQMRKRMVQYHAPRLGAYLPGRSVVLVDDGLATGLTMRAAIQYARRHGATDITVAVPCASPTSVRQIEPEVERVVALLPDPDFVAVSRYYIRFPEVSDDEVAALLAGTDRAPSGRLLNPSTC